jgi:hypothetical protein
MHCKELESVLEAQGLGELSKDARLHLATCGACQGLVADLDAIVVAAKSLPAEVAPPDRIWISLRAQLEAEGLIKEPVEISEQPSWWESLTAWMKPRTFAIVAAAALVLAAAVYVTRLPHDSSPGAAKNQPALETPRPAPPHATSTAPPSSPSPGSPPSVRRRPRRQPRP